GATASAEGSGHAPPPDVFPADEARGPSALEKLRPLAANGTGSNLVACLSLIPQLAAGDCRGAFDLFRGWPSEERHILQRSIARRWASLAPDDALQAVLQTRDLEIWDGLGRETARALVNRDPERALE